MTDDTPNAAPQTESKGGRRFSFAPRTETLGDGTRDVLASDRHRKTQRYLMLSVIVILGGMGVSLSSLTKEEDIKIQVDITEASPAAQPTQPTKPVPAPQSDGQSDAQSTVQEDTQEDAIATLTLEDVTYKSVTKEGNDIVVSAEQISESASKPDELMLSSPRAEIETESGVPMTLRSDRGVLFRDQDLVHLDGEVIIVRPDIGYTLLTERAVAYLDTGVMTSDVSVRAFSPQAEIVASGMIIGNKGKDVLFKGRSVLTLKQR